MVGLVGLCWCAQEATHTHTRTGQHTVRLNFERGDDPGGNARAVRDGVDSVVHDLPALLHAHAHTPGSRH